VLKEALLMIAAGLAVGVPTSLAAARMARSLLFGIRPEEPPVLFLGVATLLAIGLAAALIPARRAARIDPMRALRVE
jgi:ABC-type antimicrobial peptide transport system permease subunit